MRRQHRFGDDGSCLRRVTTAKVSSGRSCRGRGLHACLHSHPRARYPLFPQTEGVFEYISRCQKESGAFISFRSQRSSSFTSHLGFCILDTLIEIHVGPGCDKNRMDIYCKQSAYPGLRKFDACACFIKEIVKACQAGSSASWCKNTFHFCTFAFRGMHNGWSEKALCDIIMVYRYIYELESFLLWYKRCISPHHEGSSSSLCSPLFEASSLLCTSPLPGQSRCLLFQSVIRKDSAITL